MWNIGGEEHAPRLKPVSIRIDDYSRLGFESERLSDRQVVVYLPGVPDAWIGSVVLVPDDQMRRLMTHFPLENLPVES